MKRVLLLVLIFLLLTTITTQEPIEIRKAVPVFKVKRLEEYKNFKPKDYSKYLIIKEEPSFKVPRIRHENKQYDIELLPWGETNGEDFAIGFQVKINF